MIAPSAAARSWPWRHGTQAAAPLGRALPDETAIALTYNRETYAVMMATPADIEDFAIGFSLTEGVIRAGGDIEELELIEAEGGIEARMWLAPDRLDAVRERRRRIAGPTGCGLCGIDSLREALRPPPRIAAGTCFTPGQVAEAMRAMECRQTLGHETRAVHAAALWTKRDGLVAVREDVGRHNALDKLVGAVQARSVEIADGMLLLSSRVSIEMVQKACVLGAPLLVAVSAPTLHAVRLADQAGLTLVGIARTDGFEVFTSPHRVVSGRIDSEDMPRVA